MALETIWQQAQSLLEMNGVSRARKIAAERAALLEREGDDEYEDWLAIVGRIGVLAKLKTFDA